MRRLLRYSFILLLAALGTCLAALSGWRYARASAPVSGPIILISIESLRADRVSTYGYPHVTTPAIDRLAADGVVFERAYSHVPQSLPAYAALLSGRLPFETGIRDAVGFSVPVSERLLAEMLRDRGFETGGVVSSALLRKETGISQGFAFFDDDVAKNEPTHSLRREPLESERVAETWLESVGTPRAFLFLHIDGFAQTGEPASAPHVAYDAAVARADEAVGQLVRFLKSHQLYDQSTIILASDHGEGLGEHGEQAHGLFVYEEALRVPLIIKPSAGEGAGRRVKNIVQHVDLVPTILDLAKAPLPGNLRGQSLTPLFSHEGGRITNELAYSESLYGLYHFGWSDLATLTDGRYRYIQAPREELYDLDVDPRQTNNLADTHTDIVETFRNELAQILSATPQVRGMEAVSDDDRNLYQTFGYVGVAEEPQPPRTRLADPKDKGAVLERYRAGVSHLLARNYKAAITDFQAIAQSEPSMRDVWMGLGDASTLANRPEIALDAYQHAMHLAPRKMDAFLETALTFLQLKRLDEASDLAQRVIGAETADQRSLSLAHEVVARVALVRHDPDVARAEATLAEKADGTRPVRAYIEGKIAFDRHRYVEAFESFDLALDQLAKTPGQSLGDLRLCAAESLLRLERFPEAEELFLAELTNSPDSGRARAGLMAVYKATGRGSEAAALAQH